MFNMEKICGKISQKIGRELNYDKNQVAVINYGIFAFLQTMIAVLSVIILGAIFNVLLESLIVSLTISILRKYSGGAHASTPGGCASLGAIVCVGSSFIIKNTVMTCRFLSIFLLVTFSISYYLLSKLAPVDSIAKPITNEEKINTLKRSSILILTLYLIIVLLNLMAYLRNSEIRFLIYSMCICTGILLQVLSLTKTGHKLLKRIDAITSIGR